MGVALIHPVSTPMCCELGTAGSWVRGVCVVKGHGEVLQTPPSLPFSSLLAACSKGFKKQGRCKPPVLIPTAVLLVLTCIWAETMLHPSTLLQLFCLL